MNKLFNLDSPFMTKLSKFADMVILSILWVVCCIPVFTIGPATAALYHVTLKLARKEDEGVIVCFFQGFKKNFKQGVVLNLIFLVLGAVLAMDYFYWGGIGGTAAMICSVLFLVLFIWMLCIMFYAYPLQAQFVNSIRRTLMNAMILSTQKFGDTIVIFLLNMIPIIVGFVSYEMFVRAAPIWVLVAPAVIAYLCSRRFVVLFAPYIAPQEAEEIETE